MLYYKLTFTCLSFKIIFNFEKLMNLIYYKRLNTFYLNKYKFLFKKKIGIYMKAFLKKLNYFSTK